MASPQYQQLREELGSRRSPLPSWHWRNAAEAIQLHPIETGFNDFRYSFELTVVVKLRKFTCSLDALVTPLEMITLVVSPPSCF